MSGPTTARPYVVAELLEGRGLRELGPSDPAGVGTINSVLVTPDGAARVYSYEQTLSELYLIQGVE